MTLARLCGVASLLLLIVCQSKGQGHIGYRVKNFHEEPLEQVLQYIEKEFHVDISYGDEQVAPHLISRQIVFRSVPELLQKALDGTDLVFTEQLDNVYVIKPGPHYDRIISVQGSILDSSSRKSIPYSCIRLIHHPNVGSLVDEEGSFSFDLDKLLHGQDTLQVYHFGYTPILISVTDFLRQKKDFYTFTLRPRSHSIPAVEIQGGPGDADALTGPGRNSSSRGPSSVSIENSVGTFRIDPNELGFISGIGEPDILRTLQALPGVQGLNESAGSLSIRGGGAEENQVILDGMTIYNTNRFFGLIGAVNQQAIQNVSLYSSGYDAKHGGRTGGIIEMEGRPQKSRIENPSFGTGVNIMSFNSLAEIPLAQNDESSASVMVTGRASLSGLIQTPPYRRLIEGRMTEGLIFNDFKNTDANDILVDPRYTFYDINGKINWLAGKQNILSLSFFRGEDQLSYVNQKRSSTFSRRIEHQLDQLSTGASLNWKIYWNKDNTQKIVSQNRLVFSGVNNDYQYRARDYFQDGKEERYSVQRKNLEDISLQHNSTWRPDDHHKVEVGFQTQRIQTHVRDRRIWQDTLISLNINDFDQEWVQATYLQDTWTPNDQWMLKYGVRHTYLFDQQRQLWSPRLSVRYSPDKHWKFSLAQGRYFQYLRQYLYINDLGFGENFWRISGDEVPFLSSDHLQGGVAYENKKWVIGIEGYWKQTQGLTGADINYDPRFYRFTADTSEIFTTGRASIVGMDFYAKFHHRLYLGWISYTLSKTLYNFDELNGGQAFAAMQDRRHMLKWINKFNLERFEFSAVFMWMSGSPITEIIEVNPLPGSEEMIPTLSSTRNGQRLPVYHRLDLSAACTLIDRKEFFGQMGLSLFNAYNRQNIRDWIPSTNLQNQAHGSNPASAMVQPRDFMGFSPNLFIKLEF